MQEGDPQAGYLLLAMVVMCALVLIALAVAAPILAKDLRRDKEVESEHRAQEYVRAIQLFYRKNNAYPPSIKALESTNNVRYLRKQYIDPLTGQADWRLIHLGEQKTTVKGFFGKDLEGIGGGGGGLGSAAGMQSGGGSTTVSNTNPLSSGFGGASIGSPTQSAGTGGTGTAGGTSAGTPGAAGSSSGSGSGGGGMFGDSAGGGSIVGVGTSRTGESILTPNQQASYEDWEFWYDPRVELMKKNVSIFGGGISSQSATGLGTASSLTGTPGTATPPTNGTQQTNP